MNVKCTCNNCSTHLEFDSASAGQTVACPSCGIDTKLYVPTLPPIPKIDKPAHMPSAAVSNPLAWTAAQTLRLVRQQTCYKTLRGLIDWVQAILIAAAALALIAAVAQFFLSTEEKDLGLRILALVGTAFGCVLAVVLAIAGKQAALLMVDIADCQIQTRTPAVE
jgi:hypothetical protein